LNWIDRVNRSDSERKIIQEFNTQFQTKSTKRTTKKKMVEQCTKKY